MAIHVIQPAKYRIGMDYLTDALMAAPVRRERDGTLDLHIRIGESCE